MKLYRLSPEPFQKLTTMVNAMSYKFSSIKTSTTFESFCIPVREKGSHKYCQV